MIPNIPIILEEMRASVGRLGEGTTQEHKMGSREQVWNWAIIKTLKDISQM